MEAREYLHGKPHRLRMKLTEVEPGQRIRYRIGPGLSGEFEVGSVDGEATFTASISMGTEAPVLGPLVDGVLRRLFGARIEAIRQHQAEEGANLKVLLERGTAG
jgi:hypothetical protein